jgi:hypothetical protein
LLDEVLLLEMKINLFCMKATNYFNFQIIHTLH